MLASRGSSGAMFLQVRPSRMLATVFLSLIANCCLNASLVMLIGAVRMALMVASSFALLGLLMGDGGDGGDGLNVGR
jgi:hypothetical protein